MDAASVDTLPLHGTFGAEDLVARREGLLQANMDLRYDTPLANTMACDADWITGGNLGIANAKLIEEKTRFGKIAPYLIYFAGYGPLLCAVTFGSYVLEFRGAAMVWDKTEKTGKVS